MRTIIGACIAASFLAGGCTTTSTADKPLDVGPFPDKYQSMIHEKLYDSLKDPYSVRDLTMTKPFARRVSMGMLNGGEWDVWVSCVRYNAKNSYGAYIGLQNHAFLMTNNGVLEVLQPAAAHRAGCLQ